MRIWSGRLIWSGSGGPGCEGSILPKPPNASESSLRDVVAWLKAGKVPGVAIIGVAASLLGRLRLTQNVDALILVDKGLWADFLTAGAEYGFMPQRDEAWLLPMNPGFFGSVTRKVLSMSIWSSGRLPSKRRP